MIRPSDTSNPTVNYPNQKSEKSYTMLSPAQAA